MLQFHLIGPNFTRISPKQWSFQDLHAHFRRLYNPDRPGSTVTVSGESFPLLPDHVYPIQPEVHFQAKTLVSMIQFNIHFLIPPFIGAEGRELLQLKITPPVCAGEKRFCIVPTSLLDTSRA